MIEMTARKGRAIQLYMQIHKLRWMLQPRPGELPEEEEVYLQDRETGQEVRVLMREVESEYDAYLKEINAIRRAEKRRLSTKNTTSESSKKP